MKVNYSFNPFDEDHGWFDFVIDNKHWDCKTFNDNMELRFDQCIDNDDYDSVCESLELTVIELFEWID